MIQRVRRLFEAIIPFLGVILFGGALLVLRHELQGLAWTDVRAGVAAVPFHALLAATLLTGVSFAVLSGYDRLALGYARRPLERARSSLASFLGYAFSHALGFPVFTGAPVRYRLYSWWGLSTEEVARVVVFCTATFWVGILATGSLVFLLAPAPLPEAAPLPFETLRPLGFVFLGVLLLYLGWTRLAQRTVRVAGFEFPVPAPREVLGQLTVGGVDWIVTALVLFVLLPTGHGLGFVHFLGLFLVAQFVGQLSHVPGGLGVVEAVLVVLLPSGMLSPALLGSLLVWRAVYYLAPLLLAIALLGYWEVRVRRRAVERTMGAVGRGALVASPVLLAGGTFLAGGLLLVYGSVPAPPGHLAWVDRFVPHTAFELSHFLASLSGAGLLVLAWGLLQRLSAAYHLTLALLVLGLILSLLRGFELLPAVTLGLLLLALLPARQEFFREASLTAEPFAPGWVALILGVLVGTGWLLGFAHGREGLSDQVWWSFTVGGDASRSFRAITGASALLLLFGATRLLRPVVPRELVHPPGELPESVVAAAQGSRRASSLLVLSGDKNVLVSESGESFLMYGVEGRSWVSLGDPVGNPVEAEELVWHFRKLAFHHRGWPVFYQVRPERLPLYLDAGLSLLKLGEEARVPLEGFSLDGPRWKEFRQTLNRAGREGVTFELVPPEGVASLLPELREVSDAWLASRNTREKGFSVGTFDPDYLCRTPMGVARQGGRVLGFVNVLAPDPREEFTADLMRYRPDAMKGVMEFLFAHLLLHGRAEGYRWFSLGMAPLSGLDDRPLAPLWARLGAAVFRHGEHFYNFQGLRAYKEKFGPEWQPRYLACPGGLALPRILANVGGLIAGGLTGVVRR
jgi:phosphatidylglycerol lysyltransferase